MDEDEPDVYDVESIIDSKQNRGVVKHRLKWVVYTELEDIWETLDMLNDCPLKLQKFRNRFINKAHDPRNV